MKSGTSKVAYIMLVSTFRYKLSNLPLKSSSSSFSLNFLRNMKLVIGNPAMIMTLATVTQAFIMSPVVSRDRLVTEFQVVAHCLRYPSRNPLMIELKNSFLLNNVTIVLTLNEV